MQGPLSFCNYSTIIRGCKWFIVSLGGGFGVLPTRDTSPKAFPSLPGAHLSSLVSAGHNQPHLSFQIPPGQDSEAQGLEAPLQLLTVNVGAFSSRQTRVSGEIDVIEDQAVSAGICFQLINLAGTRHN